ncbi:MAG: phage major tail protein, TP901-1 family [Microvirga sp.]|nr:phage major tail protein, TP901-1 family [Microvirga sp.]
MAAQKGRDLLLKIHGGEGFVAVAGLRARQIAFNAETVDVTHAESVGRWRELLGGAGVFRDAASDALMREAFFDGGVREFRMDIPDFGAITGAFQIVALEYRGDHAAEVTFEIALESAGALAFEPA